MFYTALKNLAGISFNLLNLCLGGNLPPFASTCIIVEDEGRYLTLKRRAGRVVFPGGLVRWRERPAAAARREGEEETGLQLRIGEAIGFYPGIAQRMNMMSTVCITYQASPIGGELRASEEGQPCWMDEQTLRTRLCDYHIYMFEDYLAYKKKRVHEVQGEDKPSSLP